MKFDALQVVSMACDAALFCLATGQRYVLGGIGKAHHWYGRSNLQVGWHWWLQVLLLLRCGARHHIWQIPFHKAYNYCYFRCPPLRPVSIVIQRTAATREHGFVLTCRLFWTVKYTKSNLLRGLTNSKTWKQIKKPVASELRETTRWYRTNVSSWYCVLLLIYCLR